MKTIKFCLLSFLFSCLVGCTQLNFDRSIGDRYDRTITSNNPDTELAEVAPPKTIKELNSSLEAYFPEVKIVAPKAEQTFNRTDIEVRLNVENLPLFKDDTLQLGNHLNLVVDNEPFQPIYSIKEPIIIKNLAPGTHTIRVFAVRPWGESFKNEKAYTQTTFNVLTETNDNRPEPGIPLLTYNSPTGTYGAEPLLLDFYLTNAPLHAIAQNNLNLKDWRIKATVNGTSFILEDWQPIYLTGLEPGENWVQLELVDETGNSIENAFNNTVRVFTYNPQQNDALAKLVSDRLTLAQARPMVDKNYYIQPVEISKDIKPTNNIQSDTPVDPVAQPKPTTEVITPTLDNEPSVSVLESEEEQILEQARASLETPIFESIIEPEVTPTSDLEVPISNTMAAEDSFKTEHSEENIIVITKEESDREPSVTESGPGQNLPSKGRERVTTIVMPQPELVETSEAEVAIANPQMKSKPTTLWWKKLLVGLRQRIEALARSLPDEV